MYKSKNKLTVKKGMKRYVARRSRVIRNNLDVDGGLIKCEAYDTTYSNVNTSRARIGQHTGNIYFCETCENHWLENFLNNSKLERWAG